MRDTRQLAEVAGLMVRTEQGLLSPWVAKLRAKHTRLRRRYEALLLSGLGGEDSVGAVDEEPSSSATLREEEAHRHSSCEDSRCVFGDLNWRQWTSAEASASQMASQCALTLDAVAAELGASRKRSFQQRTNTDDDGRELGLERREVGFGLRQTLTDCVVIQRSAFRRCFCVFFAAVLRRSRLPAK